MEKKLILPNDFANKIGSVRSMKEAEIKMSELMDIDVNEVLEKEYIQGVDAEDDYEEFDAYIDENSNLVDAGTNIGFVVSLYPDFEEDSFTVVFSQYTVV